MAKNQSTGKTSLPDGLITNQETAHAIVKMLCSDFKSYESQYLSPSYSEAQARQDFINGLFWALGWDVEHRVQRNPFEQEVKVEKNVNVGTSQKRADYAFYLAPNYRDVIFFVEAKRPTLNLATDDNYFQAIRYGWNSKTPLVVLTDFREVHILDCRYRPNINTAGDMCVLKLTYQQMENTEEFSKLYWLFSREAVLDGSIEKRAAELPKRKAKGVQRGLFKGGDQAIDDAFIDDLNRMRDALARGFKAKNPQLNSNALTEITQKVLDRLVFMRFLEDKMIEADVNVGNLGANGSAWQDFLTVSAKLDMRYNGVVFKPHSIFDEDKKFRVDEEEFAAICAELDDTRSPYNFNFIPLHILGSIYEKFLEKTIEVVDGEVKLEIKRELRKAGGVYYTPEPVVRYIVERAVGAKIVGKKPADIAKLRFADIACGSGSFLITVYDELLRYHQRWYNEQNNNERFVNNGTCYLGEDQVLHLTLKTRRTILLNCVYGIDIDPQAVEVAQLSLYLKLLEEETIGSARNYQLEIGGALLPSLAENILCGNSLIDSTAGDSLFDDPQLAQRLNIFDFEPEFRKVFAKDEPGFDAIVGNPPWGAEFDAETIALLRGKYLTARASSVDSYGVFMERARMLLNDQGLLGYIVPDTFLRKDSYIATRAMLMDGGVSELVETGPVFSQVRDTWCLIFIASKSRSPKAKILHRKISRFIVSTEDRLKQFGKGQWDFESQMLHSWWAARPAKTVGYLADMDLQKLVEKIEKVPTLGQTASRFTISRGEEGSKQNIKSDARGKFLMHIPADVKPYALGEGTPISQAGLTPNKKNGFYTHPKIWITRIQKMRWRQRIVCAFDPSTASAAMKTLQVIVSTKDNIDDLKALSAVLSSSAVNLWCINYLADDLNQAYLEKVPIPFIKANKQAIPQLAKLVDQCMDVIHSAKAAQSETDKNILKRRFTLIMSKIDSVVADMYGLNAEEKVILASYKAREDELYAVAMRLKNGGAEEDEDLLAA